LPAPLLWPPPPPPRAGSRRGAGRRRGRARRAVPVGRPRVAAARARRGVGSFRRRARDRHRGSVQAPRGPTAPKRVFAWGGSQCSSHRSPNEKK
jgi:hypothetical protein